MSKEVISIDIGTRNTKIVVGKQQGNNIVINSAFMFNTPANSINDGKIMDMEALTREIRTMLSEYKIKTKKAHIVIESTAIIRRDIELPMVKEEEMKPMVMFEVEQYLPIMLSEYVIEYKILEEFIEDNLKKARILVAALPKAMAEDYFKLTKALELTPAVLDICSNSITKLFGMKTNINDKAYEVDKTVAVMDMGNSNIDVTIISKGVTKFSRLITQGGRDIDTNIANSFNLDLRQAEEKKLQEIDLRENRENTSLDGIINDTVKGSIDSMTEEVQRIFQYFTSRETGNRIDEIYLYGGSSNIKGLEEYLKLNFNLPIIKIKGFGNIKAVKLESLPLEYFLNAASAVIRL